MRLFKETFVGNTLKCNKLNERLWIYDLVYCLKILVLRDPNTIHAKFRRWVENNMLYLLNHMNAFTFEHYLQWQKDTNTYVDHNAESSKWLNALIFASSMDELNIRVNEKFYLPPVLA